MFNDALGTRMKTFYEAIPNIKLTRKIPVAVRIDGKSFHTFTKNFVKPFDEVLMKTMQDTMLKLCENVGGCIFGYTQSDEITLILTDCESNDTEAWFDYKVQKLCSVIASMTTVYFNRALVKNVQGIHNVDLIQVYDRAIQQGAMFDTRCFNIPKEEVTNLIYWRQCDATSNSIQMVAQANFSHKIIQNLSCKDLQDVLLTEKNINWNNFPIACKRGTSCIKIPTPIMNDKNETIIRNKWRIDTEMPILRDEGREYVERIINNATSNIIITRQTLVDFLRITEDLTPGESNATVKALIEEVKDALKDNNLELAENIIHTSFFLEKKYETLTTDNILQAFINNSIN